MQPLHAVLKLGQMWVPYLPAPGLEVGFSHCPSSAGSYWPHSCLQVSWEVLQQRAELLASLRCPQAPGWVWTSS